MAESRTVHVPGAGRSRAPAVTSRPGRARSHPRRGGRRGRPDDRWAVVWGRVDEGKAAAGASPPRRGGGAAPDVAGDDAQWARAVDVAVADRAAALGCAPSVVDVANAAGLEVEHVLDALHAATPLGDEWLCALALRLRMQGAGVTGIARRLGVAPIAALALLRRAVAAIGTVPSPPAAWPSAGPARRRSAPPAGASAADRPTGGR